MRSWLRTMLCSWICCVLVAGAGALNAEENPLRQFFPYGVYCPGGRPQPGPAGTDEERLAMFEQTCKDLADHNMNCAWINNTPESNLSLWFKAGKKYGVRIIPQGGGLPAFVRPGRIKNKENFDRIVLPYYKKLAETYRDQDALLAWSVMEENQSVPWFYECIADLTRKMSQWDPKHPVISLDNTFPAAWTNAQMVKPKAIVRDLYVFFADGMCGSYGDHGFRSLLGRCCRRAYAAARTCDAVFWHMGQGMQLGNYDGKIRWRMSWRYPTPAEIRWQVWTTIQQGGKGFFYFIYHCHNGNPTDRTQGEWIDGLRDRYNRETEQYRMASDVGQQLKPLMPVLLQLEKAPPQQEVVYWENTPVTGRTFVHRRTGRRFVILVNHDTKHIQPIGIELGYWPRLLGKDQRLFDLRSKRGYNYHTMKLNTLLPGDGTVCFVGTQEEWNEFSREFYSK